MDVWGGLSVRGEKEVDTIPVREKKVPHVKVLSERLMMCCRKAWPGEITQQASWRVPIRDWMSHRWQTYMYLDDQPNSIDCEGRKVFLGAIRMFKSSNKVRTQHIAVAQKEEGAGWEKRSLRIWIMDGKYYGNFWLGHKTIGWRERGHFWGWRGGLYQNNINPPRTCPKVPNPPDGLEWFGMLTGYKSWSDNN